MRPTENREIERLEYWEGQLLRADDFRTQQNNDQQRRAWHNRALHNAYGVSLGLAVNITVDSSALNVDCGLAYDCQGRELLVPMPARIPLPRPKPAAKPGNESRLLVLHWREYAGQPAPSDCDPCSTTARTADFGWVRVPTKFSFDGRSGVPLALVNWDNAGNIALDKTFERPYSRRLSRPRLGSGMTPPGGTVWELWTEVIPGVVAPPQVLGLQTKVDTSAAGFTETPVYIAQLQISAGQSPPFLLSSLLPICRVDKPVPDSFLFRVWLPRVQSRGVLPFAVPISRVTQVSHEKTRIHLKSTQGFLQLDPVCRVTKADSKSKDKPGPTTIQKIDEDSDGPYIDIDSPIEDLTDKDSLRLEYLPSLERVPDVLDALKSYPRMELQLNGLDADTGAEVSGRYIAIMATDGSITVSPKVPKLKLGDKPSDVPRIAIVNAQPLDFSLVIENLGWHVCWLGAFCECGHSIECPGQVCEITAREVCEWQS